MGRAAKSTRKANAQRGQILVIFGLALVLLVGITALAVDGGRGYVLRADAQAAADAAVLGAASHWLDGSSAAATEGQMLARLNGMPTTGGACAGDGSTIFVFQDGCGQYSYRVEVASSVSLSEAQVVCSSALCSSTCTWESGSDQCLLVRVSARQANFLAGVLGIANTTVSAWAVAVPGATPEWLVS